MVDAIIPLVVYALAGVLAYKVFRFGKAELSAISKIIFNVLMPCLVFRTSYKSHLDGTSLTSLCLTYTGFTIVWILISVVIAKKVCSRNDTAAAFAACQWKTNFSLIGLAIAADVMTDEGYACFAALVIVGTALLNILIVVVTTVMVDSEKGVDFRSLFLKILKNPIIIGTVLGLILKMLPVGLPDFAYAPINGFASATTPVSLFYIGCSIATGHDVRNTKPLIILTLVKFFVAPTFAVLFSMLVGLKGPALGAMCLIHALPVASNCGILVEGSGGDGAFANEATFITMLVSIPTLFVTGIILLTQGWI